MSRYQNMPPTRRSGKALTSRSGGNMPQHDGGSLGCVRSGADGGGAVYIALRLLYMLRGIQ
jgi:hypothetical protein